MAYRECHARPRLQISLKLYRTALIGELHDDIDDPWPAGGRVCTGPRCVRPVSPKDSTSAPCSSGADPSHSLERRRCTWESRLVCRAKQPPSSTYDDAA